MNNPRNELYNICKALVDNSTADYNLVNQDLVQTEDLDKLKDCIKRCDEYAQAAKRSYAEWCKERGQWP